MHPRERIVVGLDIGTTKICCIVGKVLDGDGVEIVGFGTHPSTGLRKGVVVNIEKTIASIKEAVSTAELMAGTKVESAYVGIAGGHIKGFNSHGVIAIRNREVSLSDIERVIDAAKAVAIPMDREVIHILPQEYIIDGQDGVKEPLGMSGVRLETMVHIITGAVTSAQNIVKCVHGAGLEVRDIVLEPLASSESTLAADEKELGVALVDIGGGTTDIAIFSEGSIKHTSVLGVGGNHITNDIAVGLRTPTAEAERIKIKYGCASTWLIDGSEEIEVPSVGGRPPRLLSRQVLCEIIEPRTEEIFALVDQELMKSGYKDRLASGAVITGGSAIMEGMPELGEEVLLLPVRRGYPDGISGLTDVVRSPMYATGVGLVLYRTKSQQQGKFSRLSDDNLFNRIISRMKDWFSDFF